MSRLSSVVKRALSPFRRPQSAGASALRLRLFRQVAAKGLHPSHVVDVGAHAAAWSRDAYAVWPSAGYTLIEPQIEMQQHIEPFCRTARGKWIVAGAGAQNGTLPLTVIPQQPDSSSFATPSYDRGPGFEQRMLSIVTLDSVVADSGWPVPEIVKIDAEGMEHDVLAGARSLFGRTELFFLELPMFDYWPQQSFHTLVAAMREFGYEPYDITDINRRTSDGAIGLIEMAFAKRAGVLRDHHGW